MNYVKCLGVLSVFSLIVGAMVPANAIVDKGNPNESTIDKKFDGDWDLLGKVDDVSDSFPDKSKESLEPNEFGTGDTNSYDLIISNYKQDNQSYEPIGGKLKISSGIQKEIDQYVVALKAGPKFKLSKYNSSNSNPSWNTNTFTSQAKALSNASVFTQQSSQNQPIPFEAEGTMGLVALGGYLWYRHRKKRNQALSQESNG